ncbi:MAG: hypothetical protein JXB29_01600 [Sedimentisphaerales bacterium]|nr:hypothetical protein [Sedimentisphaerales bacterium]
MKAGTNSTEFVFTVSALAICMMLPLLANAQTNSAAQEVNAVMAQIPHPWLEGPAAPTLDEYIETMNYWAEKHPDILDVRVAGKNLEGLPIYLLKITDKSVPDEDKQVLLVSSLHAGAEQTGGTTVLNFADWLLSNEEKAVQTRRKQIILLMPVMNPYAFFVKDHWGNSQNIDPYAAGRGKLWDLNSLTFKEPNKCPEVVIFKSIVDKYKPDVHADMHGVHLRKPGRLVFESVGTAYSNYALRPWDWRITEALIASGNKAGFGYDRAEASAQRLLCGEKLNPIADKLWSGRPYFYTAHYAFAKYHTLILVAEIGWEQSGVALLKGLVNIGNNLWDDEAFAGYPVNTIAKIGYSRILAWGSTAKQRRKSRFELWQKQAGLEIAMMYPEFDFQTGFACAVSKKGKDALKKDLKKTLINLKEFKTINTDYLEAFLKDWPEGMWSVGNADNEDLRIENGISLRLRIAYRDPQIIDLRLNGHTLKESRTEGYKKWYADGFTQVQINVPPEKSRKQGLYIVTCAYKPQKLRSYGWKVPDEVTKRLNQKKITEQK